MICVPRHRKGFAIRLSIDLICIGLVAIGTLCIKFRAEPYHRGFFCDDESIQHPVLTDTVTVPMAVLIGLLLPIALIILIEALFRKEKKLSIFTQSGLFLRRKSWIMSCYEYNMIFIFGCAVTQFLTEIGKFSVGRLRPHFLTLCNPDFSKVDCSKGYITADVCTSTEEARMKDARLSFPSGHSSFAMYCMLYAILYIQTRLSCRQAPLLKPTLQVVFFCLGFFTCLSRISDYKHHWSDVLAGALLGMAVCLVIVRALTDFGRLLCVPRLGSLNNAELEEVLSSPVAVRTEFGEDSSYAHGFGSVSSLSHSHTSKQDDQNRQTNAEVNF